MKRILIGGLGAGAVVGAISVIPIIVWGWRGFPLVAIVCLICLMVAEKATVRLGILKEVWER